MIILSDIIPCSIPQLIVIREQPIPQFRQQPVQIDLRFQDLFQRDCIPRRAGKRFLIHIHPDANNGFPDEIFCNMIFNQDAPDLLILIINIVRPFDGYGIKTGIQNLFDTVRSQLRQQKALP